MVNSSKLQFTQLQSRIFRILCQHAGENLSFASVASLSDSTPAGAAKAINTIAQDLVIIRKDPKINLTHVSLARTRIAQQFKRTENLQQIYECGLIELLEEKHPGTTIILFGSFSRGEDTVRSDIDIAIIGAKPKDIPLIPHQQTLARKISIQYYSSLQEIDKELRENLCNGIVVAGGVEL